jgi:exopolyphosphatase/guanosine-5'-triphosphate,3'-diphosphate pyrophosphatase
MRSAAIDIGTNSIKLLVGDRTARGLHPILDELRVTRLGKGLVESHRLSVSSMRTSLKALTGFVRKATRLGAARIHIVGTHALRVARNGDSFLRTCARKGFAVRILAPQEEAMFAFRGASPRGHAAVVDIGGGSTEIIRGRNGQVCNLSSTSLGAVTLTERFLTSDTPTVQELDRVRRHVARFSLRAGTSRLIALGGTAVALARLEANRLGAQRIDGRAISRGRLVQWTRRVCDLSTLQRVALLGIPPTRADIFPAGLVILEEVLRQSRAPSVRVTTRGLRHGLLLVDPTPP